MQPEYSTYGTEFEPTFFYKALTPMGFAKSLNLMTLRELRERVVNTKPFLAEILISLYTKCHGCSYQL